MGAAVRLCLEFRLHGTVASIAQLASGLSSPTRGGGGRLIICPEMFLAIVASCLLSVGMSACILPLFARGRLTVQMYHGIGHHDSHTLIQHGGTCTQHCITADHASELCSSVVLKLAW